MAGEYALKPSKRTVELPGCPVAYVVVYSDRAEVTREIELTLEAGDHEIQLNNISKSLDKESLRVDGIGAASITEVSYQEIPLTTEEDIKAKNNEEVTKLNKEIDELVNKQDILTNKKGRLQEQEQLLKTYSNQLISSSKGSKTESLVDKDTIEGVLSYLDTYESSYTTNKESQLALEDEETQVAKKLQELQVKLRELTGSVKIKSQVVNQPVVGILLNVKEKGDIKIMISYVVSNASWTPKYDLRVNSLQRSMQVSYFGMIQQNTGEDWNNTKLSLSTASPNIGGTAPELKTLKINLIHPVAAYNSRGPQENIKSGDLFGGFGKGADGKTYISGKSNITMPQAQVSEGLSSSVFEIVAMATIPSDNAAHKVSISTIPLTPTFEYDTVPKLSQHAFLKARVKNESSYPMLGGPANVFLDQAFVTTTTIPNVSPQEEFSCSLGVDNSIKVLYKPVHKYREESGIISVSVMYTYRQVTIITNNRSESAIVNYTDQIPLSKDTKLKVTLVEPVVAKVKPGNPPPNPNLTSQNAVTWRVELQPSETREVTIRYTVEYPRNKEIDGL